jgi:hypothetical protein
MYTLAFTTDGSYDVSSAKPKAAVKTPDLPSSAKKTTERASATSVPAAVQAMPPVPVVDLAEGEFQIVESDGRYQILLRLAKDDNISSIQIIDGEVKVKCDPRDSCTIDVPVSEPKGRNKLKLGPCKKCDALLCIDIIVIT